MQKHIDPMSATRDLRLKTGFPEDASRWMRFVHFLALPAQLLTRYYLGVRVVGINRLVLMLLVLFMISNSGAGFEFDDRGQQWEALGGNLGVALVLFGMGIFYRFRRAAMRRQGERVHSLSMGISRFAKLRKADTTERYVDGLYVVLWGAFLDIFEIFLGSDIIGDWLVISGLCMLGVEKYVHNIRVKQYDGLLNAEGHEMAATASLQAQNSTPPAAPVAPVSTGLDPDLAERIRSRERAGMQAVIHVEAPARVSRRRPAAKAAARALALPPAAAEILLLSALAIALATAHGRANAAASQRPAAQTIPSGKAEAGMSADAVLRLANDYYYGRNGKPQDPVEAARLFRIAADGGNLQAVVNLGHMNRFGEGGFKKDPKKAFALYWDAAAKFHPVGLSYYADMLASGEGGVKDETLAVRYYEIAARTLPRATFGLGLMYRDGRGGLTKSDAKYLELCTQAAEADFDVAQLSLGFHYLFGDHGVTADPIKAAMWLQRAADQDVAQAKTMLGRMYAGGNGVEHDDAKAASLFIEAADGGDDDAKYQLALLVLEGRGGQAQDTGRFVCLVVEAAAGGVGDAQRALDVLKNMARKGDKILQSALAQYGAKWQ